MGFSDKQLEIIRYNNNHHPIVTILEGAVRSGKTFIDNYLWVDHVGSFRGQGKKFIMTGHTISSLQRNVLTDIEETFGFNTKLNKNNEFQLLGNTIACFGTDKVDSYKSMKGFTAHGWYANEITEQHRNSVDQARKRCSGTGSRLFWDTNPAGPNHYIKTDFVNQTGEKLSNGQVHIKSWHFTLDDNPFLDPVYVESLKKSTPSGMWYDRDILGQWVAAEGMIYKDFDYSVHVVDTLPEIKEYFAGVDWGYDHVGVIGLYGTDHDGNAFRIKEIAEKEKTIGYWVRQAKKLIENYGFITFYCDPARPDYIQDFKDAGINAQPAKNEVVEGITFVAEQFIKNKLYIHEQNKNYLSLIYNYRWKENSAKEQPIKEDDDEMDSERYAIYSHLATPNIVSARWI
jgi:PBSX family phage terminase large subunit